MRILFCDDDYATLELLQKYVSEFFAGIGASQPETAAYTSGDLLIANEKQADIAFLDVEMPGRSGIHIGARLKEFNSRIKIFIVTSYPDYIDEAMRVQVFRYLSKPIDKNRLFRNLKDALYQYSIESHKIAISTKDGVIIRQAESIVCVEAVQRKTFLYTTGEVLQTTTSIDEWRNTLALPCFFSPYRGFIINMKYVVEIKKDIIILNYGGTIKEAYLARRKFAEFKNAYIMYLESMK